MSTTTPAVALFAALVMTTAASAQQSATRALNQNELIRSTHSAMTDVDSATGNAPSMLTRSADRRSLPAGRTSRARHRVLLTERRPGLKGSPARLADVYIYNYNTESLLHRVVDTATDRVVFRSTSRGQQLPLTAGEADRAVATLFADAAATDVVRAEYSRITGSSLDDLSTVQHKAVVYIANESSGSATASCGSVRCAQILLYTAGEQIAIDIRPVVRLADDTVIAVDHVSRTGHTH